MYDSSTKIPFAVITGNYKQLGYYDECLRVRSDHGFVGKACSAKVVFSIANSDDDETSDDEPDMRDLLVNAALASGLKNWTSGDSIPYQWLWCVPSSCSARDVANAIEVGLDQLKISRKVDFVVNVGNDSCHTEESDRAVFVVADWIYISLLVLFGIVILASTAYDLIEQRNPAKSDLKGTKRTILTCFSVYTNGKSFLNVQRGADTIDCLDGIRLLSICWIIYGHTTHLEIDGPTLDLSRLSTMHKRWDTLLYLNFNVSVDIFFLLSGTLLAYAEMGRKEKNPVGYKFKFWNIYIHRYFRLTPTYAMLVGFYTTLFYKIGSGPFWDSYVGMNSRTCMTNWWTNFLYINNYVDLSSQCMQQSWYLAADMQMVWLSPILLYPMLGNGKTKRIIFLALLATAFAASILTTFLITYYERLSSTMLFYKNDADLRNVYKRVYRSVYTRAGPYLVGLGLGYFLRRTKNKKLTMHISLVIGGWIVAMGAGLAVIFGPREFFLSDHEYNGFESAFYAGFHRPVFALAVAWIVVADCVFGCAGPVGTFLSWSGWVLFSKLTYSAYLSHYIIILYNAGSSRTTRSYTIFGSVHSFFGNLVMTLLISVVLHLCCEVPFCRLDHLLVTRNRNNTAIGSSRKNESSPENDRPTSISSNISKSYNDLIERSAREANNSFVPSTSSTVHMNIIYDDEVHDISSDLKAAGVSGSKDAGAVTNMENL